MVYKCNENRNCGPKVWTGEIRLLSRSSFHYEAEVQTRGTYFHMIVFKSRTGNSLCVPNFNIGCELSRLNDTFWNSERIRAQLDNEVDAESLVSAVKALAGFEDNK